MPVETPLGGKLSVVHLASGIAGAYCTKLLVDGGATAVRIEAPDGDLLRRRSASQAPVDPETGGLLFQYLAGSTSSVIVDPTRAADRDAAWSLIEAADIVIWSPGSAVADAAEFSPAQIRARAPGAVVVTLTPFGLVGLASPRPATEFTLQAMSGGWIGRGDARREPLAAGGEHGEWVAGVFAAVGALAAWRRAEDTGAGELVDVSMLDALHLTQTMFAPTFETAAGRPYRSFRVRTIPLIHPTKDGYVGFQITTGQQWLDFCVVVERPDWAEDPTLNRFETRVARHEELNAYIDGWTSQRTTAEVVEVAALFRLPVAPVNNGATLPKFEQAVARGWYVRNPQSGFLQPAAPYAFAEAVAARPPAPSPRLGEHDAAALARPRKTAPAAPAAPKRPLPFEGLKVMDFTAFWAGPIISHFFATLGAEVIHVESTKRPDGLRAATLRPDMGEGWWEASPFFAATNTNKRGLTLDMSTPRGRELARRLIAQSDVLVENFSSRVMEQWGLDYESLRAENPGLVMVRAPGFGNTGPWRDHVAYATTIEQASGLAWVTGFADDRPEVTGGACDPVAGTHAAFATMLALEHRRHTGQGALLEVPQFTTGMSITAEQVIEHSATGTLLGRNANRSWTIAPQGAYRVADATPKYDTMPPDDWIAISVATEEQWRALCAVIGATQLAADPDLAGVAGRMRRHDEIDAVISAWARPLPGAEAVEALLAAGVPAARFVGMNGLHELPEVQRRGLYEQVEHSTLGPIVMIGYPAQFEHGPHRIHRSNAPSLGEHNREILQGMLGLSPAEVDELQSAGVIGDRPQMASAW